jgi:CubicO group peptidase (beta-lactamase class C family)
MRKRRYLIIIGAALGLLADIFVPISAQKFYVNAQVHGDFDISWIKVEKIWTAGLKSNKTVGSSLMLVKSGQIIKQNFYGFADRDQQRPVDINTIYHWASITKTFTAVAIMQLRDRGMLSLDDPVIEYIPELKSVYNPYGPMADITIRHLLGHSSGFRGPTWPWGGDEDWHPYEPQAWEQLTAMFPYTQILFKPGTEYSYSNPAIVFLGKIIERLSGEDYEVYTDKNILKPLGMVHSYFDISPYHLLPYRSNSYFIKNGVVSANGLDFDTGVTVSNGGLNAPLSDMAHYLAFLTGDLIQIPPLLTRTTLEEMWQPQIIVKDKDPFKTAVGLSFFILEKDGRRLIGHTGEQKGFMSFFYLEPGSKTAAILVFNTINQVDSGISPTRLLMADILDSLQNSW